MSPKLAVSWRKIGIGGTIGPIGGPRSMVASVGRLIGVMVYWNRRHVIVGQDRVERQGGIRQHRHHDRPVERVAQLLQERLRPRC